MPKECIICHKAPMPGAKYKRRGQIKRTGGAGSKIVGKSLRRFLPNLQRVKIKLDGTTLRAYVCTGCISANNIIKA